MNPDDELNSIAKNAQAFLFAEGGSLALRRLAELVGCKEPQLMPALRLLSERLKDSGISLVLTDTEAALAVSSDAAGKVQEAFELELAREIGSAGLEVLAILLYRGPSTRADIDYIRGVNTSTTLRTLLARGLVLRASNPSDAREFIYRPTVELLAHLGVTDSKNLPDYVKIKGELASFEIAQNPIKSENGKTTDTANDAQSAS